MIINLNDFVCNREPLLNYVNSLNITINLPRGLLAIENLVFLVSGQIFQISEDSRLKKITLKILLFFRTFSLYIVSGHLFFFTRRTLFCVFFNGVTEKFQLSIIFYYVKNMISSFKFWFVFYCRLHKIKMWYIINRI